MEETKTQYGIEITYKFQVSGSNRTLQAFDFIVQAVDQEASSGDVDTLTLCQLVQDYCMSKTFQPELVLVDPEGPPQNNKKEDK